MSSRRCAATALFAIAMLYISTSALAYSERLSSDRESRCAGMYARNAIPFATRNSTITVQFDEVHPPVQFAVLVYNVLDEDSFRSPTTGMPVICDDMAKKSHICNETSQDAFLVHNNRTLFVANPLNVFREFLGAMPDDRGRAQMIVETTGLYCVLVEATDGPDQQFLATVTYENPYGSLPALEYPKLPFFGLISVIYLILGSLWLIVALINWRDLLMLQHYVTMTFFFIVVEMAFNYGYYENYNSYGSSSKALLAIVVVLNSARNSISFFMLLIVALGYGVVKPSLGGAMKKCVGLALVHFVFGVLYAAGSMLITDVTPALALIFALPLSAAMTTFYFCILQGMTDTMRNLRTKRQPVKLLMYQRLWAVLVFSVVVLIVFFIFNFFVFSLRNNPKFINTYWQWRWFLLDGWLNILYLCVFVSIAILWRPTSNNQRYGLEQLGDGEDDDDYAAVESAFEQSSGGIKLRNIGKGGEEEEDEEADLEREEDIFRWVEENVNNGHK